MHDISYGFFSPLRNDKKKSHSASKDFKECWWHDFYILRGKTLSDDQQDSSDWWVKLLNADSYFALVIGLSSFYNANNPNLISLKSNLGVLHYLNPFAPLSLLSLVISIKFKDLSDCFKASIPSLAQAFEVLATINYFLFSIPMIIVGFVTQVLFTLIHAGVAALLATCGAGINYLGNIMVGTNDQVASADEEESFSFHA